MSLVCLSPNGADLYRIESEPDDVLVATTDGVARVRKDGASWRIRPGGLEGLHVSSLMREPSRGWL